MSITTIKIRRDTASNWTSKTPNPTLALGEQGYETDTGRMKIGDGSTIWNSLLYFAAAATDLDGMTDAIATYGSVGNIFLGDISGANVTTGISNTSVGMGALNALISGNNNVAVGFNALISDTSGGDNIAIGINAMATNNAGSYNIAIGSQALYLINDTNGSANVAIGNGSLINVTLGGDNTAIGNAVGSTLVDGHYNVLIGESSDVTGATAENQIAIGTGAVCTADSTAQIGSIALTNLKIGGDSGSIQTGNTTNTSSTPWMLGQLVPTPGVPTVVDTTQYLEVMVGGALIKLVIAV
jgi:carbonic anhydrase/acetyltransferase-like protein (isoleucine patch superfamily)